MLIAVELKWLIDEKFQEAGDKIREAILAFLFKVVSIRKKQRSNKNELCYKPPAYIFVYNQACVIR